MRQCNYEVKNTFVEVTDLNQQICKMIMPYGEGKSWTSRVKGVPGMSADRGGKICLDSKFKQSKQANKQAKRSKKESHILC